MLDEAQIKSVALFFFLGLMDEKLAFQATLKTIRKCRKRMQKGRLQETEVPSVVVYLTNDVWDRMQRRLEKGHSMVTYEAGWLVPDHVELGPWREFKKESDPDEFLAVLWSCILKYSDDQISKGLGVTSGTVRHRVGRGLRVLGAMKNLG